MLLNIVFLVEFERMLYFQGFNGIFGEIVVIFNVVRMCRMLDFSMFCRSGYRSGYFGVFVVKYLGNADFTRGLWIEEICRSWLPAACPKM